jgi:myo-inositol-1(or 4)-monophosphatase
LPAAEAHRLRDPLIAAVRDGGAIAMRAFRGQQKHWMKTGNSPVSEADMAVDALLHERLLALSPGFGWLSEESVDDPSRLATRFVWIVDPIDGTRSYLEGREDWCISAALVHDGRPVLAAIYAPVTDELFAAVAGEGASVNGAPMAAAGGDTLDGARLAGPVRYQKGLAAVVPGVVAAPKIFSLALRITRVAQGAIEVAVAGGNSHDWDLAAADLLVHEAGGAMTTFAAQPVTYNRPEPVHGALVAAGRGRHAALLHLIRDHALSFS